MDLMRNILKGKKLSQSELKKGARHEMGEFKDLKAKALERSKGRVGSGKSRISGKQYKMD